MDIKHSILTSSPNVTEVILTLIPQSESENKLLRRAAEEQVDISDGMIEQVTSGYLRRHFSGMSVLAGKFLDEPGKMLFRLQLARGMG